MIGLNLLDPLPLKWNLPKGTGAVEAHGGRLRALARELCGLAEREEPKGVVLSLGNIFHECAST